LSLESIVAEIDSEIASLEQAKALLSEKPTPKRGPGRPRLNAVVAVAPVKQKRRRLSAAARAKIAAAQKARWAKVRAAKGKSDAAKSTSSK
jgi:hypothetical protein